MTDGRNTNRNALHGAGEGVCRFECQKSPLDQHSGDALLRATTFTKVASLNR
jgi:hypothetical protein